MARKTTTPDQKKRRLTIQSVKEVSLVGLGANQPAKVLLFKSADAPASDAAPAPADSRTATVPLSEEIARALASVLEAAAKAKKPCETDMAAGKKKPDPAEPDADDDASGKTPATPDPAEPDEDDPKSPKKKKPASQEKSSMTDQSTAAESVDKAAELAATVKALEAQLASEQEKTQKASTEAADLAKKVADQGAVIAKAAREALVAKTVAEVKDTFKALPGVKPADLAEHLIALREVNADLAKAFESMLKSANDAIENSVLFKTVGSLKKSEDAVSAEDEYEQLVTKFHAENPKLTREAAAAKAIETPAGKSLYGRMINVQRAQ